MKLFSTQEQPTQSNLCIIINKELELLIIATMQTFARELFNEKMKTLKQDFSIKSNSVINRMYLSLPKDLRE